MSFTTAGLDAVGETGRGARGREVCCAVQKMKTLLLFIEGNPIRQPR